MGLFSRDADAFAMGHAEAGRLRLEAENERLRALLAKARSLLLIARLGEVSPRGRAAIAKWLDTTKDIP